MSVHTRGQKQAQAAYAAIDRRQPDKDYTSFAKKFPALVHSCGLAQAVAFAAAKKETDYLDDLTAVLNATSGRVPSRDTLSGLSRDLSVSAYLRLSRDTLAAAVWLKRYVEAAAEVAKVDGEPAGGGGS